MADYRTADGSLRCTKGRFADEGEKGWPSCENAARWRSPDYDLEGRIADMSWAVWCDEHRHERDWPLFDRRATA